MVDPTQDLSKDEEQTAERKPELERETLKDLTPKEGAEDVKGGPLTTANQGPACYCGSM